MSTLIYHITTNSQWQSARAIGSYEAPSLATEGFIHCSTLPQVAGVLQRYYQGQQNLVLLTIDTDKLLRSPVYEMVPSVNEEFPHIYGPVNLTAVIKVSEVEL
jgi:uncharacterized protein (DUF952 family)